jgi:hypothetical protein
MESVQHRECAQMLQRQLTLAGGAVVELEETVQSDWGALPGELLLHILRDFQHWTSTGFQSVCGGREVSCAVRLVSRSWKEAHDSGCVTMILMKNMTDEGMQLVCTRFPALTRLTLANQSRLTETAMLAVASMPSLTHLSLLCNVTHEAMRAMASMPSLTSLNIGPLCTVSDEALRAVSEVTKLTSLNLSQSNCDNVTAEGMQALRSLPALRQLNGPNGQRVAINRITHPDI